MVADSQHFSRLFVLVFFSLLLRDIRIKLLIVLVGNSQRDSNFRYNFPTQLYFVSGFQPTLNELLFFREKNIMNF